MRRINLHGAQIGYGEDDPEGAHKVTNHGETTARVVMFSTVKHPAVTVYPDGDKLAVHTGGEDDIMVGRESGLGYYDRES